MHTMDYSYQEFLRSTSSKHWQRIGLNRRAGVNVPLFSIYSNQSIGNGDIEDLRILIDWCKSTNLSIIQLLPLNDIGYSFMPYDAQSTFALEPLYLSFFALHDVDPLSFQKEIKDLKKQFPAGLKRVNYQVKKPKIELLERMFLSVAEDLPLAFWKFQKKETFWLRDYALFKCLKKHFTEKPWYEWDDDFKNRDKEKIADFEKSNEQTILFYEWIQWQLFEQLSSVKSYATENKVLLMGDLPFLVSRDSADVWSHQDYFKLHLAAGAPPDAYSADGQRWGMPPYQWNKIEESGYDYLENKVRYGSFFYDLLRIDHVVGMFRLWAIDVNEPLQNNGKNGVFDPFDESEWEEHGRKLLQVMTEKGDMLCCAEDLGVVPDCSYKVLNEFAIPGMDIQRWTRDWHGDQNFIKTENYRKCAVTMLSTHDMSHFLGWWLCELASIDKKTLEHFCAENEIDFQSFGKKYFVKEYEGFYQWKIKDLDRSKLEQELDRPVEKIGWFLDLFDRAKRDYSFFSEFLEIRDAVEPEAVLYDALMKANETASIFSIQFIQDWIALGGYYTSCPWSTRMNVPGTVKDENWSLVLPLSLEEMMEFQQNEKIRKIVKESGRGEAC